MDIKVGRVLPRVRRSGSLTPQNYASNLQMYVSEATYLIPARHYLARCFILSNCYHYLSNTHTSRESICLEMECAALLVNVTVPNGHVSILH
jgi:hypothetical protein